MLAHALAIRTFTKILDYASHVMQIVLAALIQEIRIALPALREHFSWEVPPTVWPPAPLNTIPLAPHASLAARSATNALARAAPTVPLAPLQPSSLDRVLPIVWPRVPVATSRVPASANSATRAASPAQGQPPLSASHAPRRPLSQDSTNVCAQLAPSSTEQSVQPALPPVSRARGPLRPTAPPVFLDRLCPPPSASARSLCLLTTGTPATASTSPLTECVQTVAT